jgi:hypothetical protein
MGVKIRLSELQSILKQNRYVEKLCVSVLTNMTNMELVSKTQYILRRAPE